MVNCSNTKISTLIEMYSLPFDRDKDKMWQCLAAWYADTPPNYFQKQIKTILIG